MYSVVSVVRSEILQHGQCRVSDQMNRDTTAWSVSCLWSDDQGVQVPNFGTLFVSCRQLGADDNGSVLLQPSTCVYIYIYIYIYIYDEGGGGGWLQRPAFSVSERLARPRTSVDPVQCLGHIPTLPSAVQRWPLSRRLMIGDKVQSCVVRGTVSSLSRAVGAERVRV